MADRTATVQRVGSVAWGIAGGGILARLIPEYQDGPGGGFWVLIFCVGIADAAVAYHVMRGRLTHFPSVSGWVWTWLGVALAVGACTLAVGVTTIIAQDFVANMARGGWMRDPTVVEVLIYVSIDLLGLIWLAVPQAVIVGVLTLPIITAAFRWADRHSSRITRDAAGSAHSPRSA
jgi:hypothetical protein